MKVVAKHARPDPLKDPEGYQRWLDEFWLGDKLPVIEESYLIGPGAAVERVTEESGIDGSERWFVVQTNPRCEDRAEGGLRDAGFSVYVPRMTRWRRIHKRVHTNGRPKREKVALPLFPRYLFVGFSGAANFYGVRRVDGVAQVLGVQGTPQAIRPEFVGTIRAHEDQGEFDETKSPYKVGETVRVTSGPFAMFSAVLVSLRDNERVRLLLSIFGRSSEIEMEVAGIEKVC